MKKLIVLICVFLMGCETQLPSVPIFIYDMKDAYINDFSNKLKDELKNYDVTVFDAQNSQIIQNDDINTTLKQKGEVLLINPVDRLSVYAMIEKAQELDKTLIFFNREPLEEDMNRYDKLYYVGADPSESGEIQAEMISDLFGNPKQLSSFDKNQDNVIQLIILKGEQGHQDAEARTKVVIESLENLGYQLEIMDTINANWDRSLARELSKSIVELYQDSVELIISNNDAMALGAIETLKDSLLFQDLNQDGRIDRETEVWIPIVGVDGLSVALEQMELGYLYGTVTNDSTNQALMIAELCRYLISGRDMSEFPYPVEKGKYIWVSYLKLSSFD